MHTPYLAFADLTRPKEQDMRHVVMAEMVGSVFEVVAGAGDLVEPTDTLVILESMKMEIPVLAEVSGVVNEMTVIEGDVVNEGDSIAVIDGS
jgi:biotin carboxyl carrier protein